jgi:hypothetical protein
MSIKLKNKKSLLTDEQIEQYCYSVEKLLIDINNRSNAKKSKKVNTTKKISN